MRRIYKSREEHERYKHGARHLVGESTSHCFAQCSRENARGLCEIRIEKHIIKAFVSEISLGEGSKLSLLIYLRILMLVEKNLKKG